MLGRLLWRVENSWGDDNGVKGFYVMNDSWFDEYVFEVAVRRSTLSAELQAAVDLAVEGRVAVYRVRLFKDDLEAAAKQSPDVVKLLDGKNVVKLSAARYMSQSGNSLPFDPMVGGQGRKSFSFFQALGAIFVFAHFLYLLAA